jgi:hypothetical protein
MLLKLLGFQRHLLAFVATGTTDQMLPLQLVEIEALLSREDAKIFELEQHRVALHDFHKDKPNVFKDKQVVPVRTIKHLGRGAWGQVDSVQNVFTGAHVARERFLLTSKKLAREYKLSFETELANLQKLSGHQHVIQYLCSYSTETTLNLLLDPVADCNLY